MCRFPRLIRVRTPTPLTTPQEHAEFTYDGEYNWFKVICLEDDTYTIRRAFAKLARKIETEAFDEHEDRMLYTDDTLVVSPGISSTTMKYWR